jgi:hypothetical protein
MREIWAKIIKRRNERETVVNHPRGRNKKKKEIKSQIKILNPKLKATITKRWLYLSENTKTRTTKTISRFISKA